ncbi:synaptotagmin-14-like [Acropora palmata]|uniref:synaptotagmin-14-like n=1 Tax=Acropora palmata TaxID=6131 RepID=UPI003D9FFC46
MDFTAKIGGFFRSIINPESDSLNTDKPTEENRSSSNNTRVVEDEAAEYDERDADFIDDEDDENTAAFLQRNSSLPLPGKSKQDSATGSFALQVPNAGTQFKRRYTLAGGSPAYGLSSLTNGRSVPSVARKHNVETSSIVSDDETVRRSAARREFGSVPARSRSETPRMFGGTPSKRMSNSSSVSDWTMDSSIRGVGRLHVVLDFTTHTAKLSVTVTKIEFPPYHQRDISLLEVSVMLLPGKRQSFRTRPRDFNEPMAMYLFPKDKIKDMSLRFRLYEQGAMGSKHLLGEGTLRLRSVDLDSEMIPASVDLQPPGSYVPEAASGAIMYEGELAISEEDRPEILLSLEYRPMTGKLLLEVIKTRNLGMLTDSKARETYVGVKVIKDNGELVSKSKTTPRRHMIDPEYNEMFLFHVPEHELNAVTVLLTVTSIASKTLAFRKQRVGRVSLGQNYSSEEELRHWYEMTRRKEKSTVAWHKINQM